MPQLLSRMDKAGWLTPSLPDILDAGAAPPGGEESIRAQALELQQAFSEQGTPARIINVRPTASRTLYIARLDSAGRSGSRHPVTPTEILRTFARITEKHPDWTLGFLPQLQDSDGAIGVLVRTEEHKAMSLRQLLVRSSFREHRSSLAFTIGVTLEQQLIVRDLDTCGHLIVFGSEHNRKNFIWASLLTLTLLNTPTELRLALAGSSSQAYETLMSTPHALGRMLPKPHETQRLLDGLVKEAQRRRLWFKDQQVDNIRDYNAKIRERNEQQLPHIVLLIDSLSDTAWQATADRWLPSVYDLLVNAAKSGIHLILTANQVDGTDVPDMLKSVLPTRVVLRPLPKVLEDANKTFHSSALRFVDAFLLENEVGTVPLELSTIGAEELQRAILYWKQTTVQRVREPAVVGNGSSSQRLGQSGLTGLMPKIVETSEQPRKEPPTPPTPPKPSPDTLARAAQMLAASEDERKLRQAQMLAAYLGWLSVGPLQDILEMTQTEARAMLTMLQNVGVLEAGENSMLRFVRLATNPLKLESA
jgi:DNA translocase FtsK/SpoIIIE-like protein